MINDFTHLHQLSDAIAGSSFHLYTPEDAYRMQQSGWGRPDLRLEGENHPNGAIIHYYLKKVEETDTVLLDILDADGNPVPGGALSETDEKLVIDALVDRSPVHTDNRPILEYSDMDLYNVVDVAPNLGRLIEFQQEDLLSYFVGSERQLAELKEHFGLYTGYYLDYVELYERQHSD